MLAANASNYVAISPGGTPCRVIISIRLGYRMLIRILS